MGTWRTFYGRKIEIKNLSHQHLSNIIWYYKLVVCDDVYPPIKDELKNRFGDICLPYYPLHSFTSEIDALFSFGYITNKHDSDIIVDGKWVGRLEYK